MFSQSKCYVFVFPGFSFIHSYELWSFHLYPTDKNACLLGCNNPPDRASLNESMFWIGHIVDNNNSHWLSRCDATVTDLHQIRSP